MTFQDTCHKVLMDFDGNGVLSVALAEISEGAETYTVSTVLGPLFGVRLYETRWEILVKRSGGEWRAKWPDLCGGDVGVLRDTMYNLNRIARRILHQCLKQGAA